MIAERKNILYLYTKILLLLNKYSKFILFYVNRVYIYLSNNN